MNNFLKNIIEGNGITPSNICLEAFQQNFENAINVEWFEKTDSYETIFYKDNLEHIATYSKLGILLEYKVNLHDGYLPEAIKNIAEEKGEIMNSVMINKGNRVEYEVIVRNVQLTRYLLNITDIGTVLQEKKL